MNRLISLSHMYEVFLRLIHMTKDLQQKAGLIYMNRDLLSVVDFWCRSLI